MERQKVTRNIGHLNGRLLVFGGVYSNFQALESIQKIAAIYHIPAERVICTGDIIGYCAEPEACVQLIKDWEIHSIAGNVEIQIRENQKDCGCDFRQGGRCDRFSRQWYPFALENVSSNSIKWMQELPDFIEFEYAGKKCLVVHGSRFHPAEYIFSSTPWMIKQANFHPGNFDVILAGHCGLPFHSVKGNKYWLNPGVIGMPANDGTPRVWYMIIDDDPEFHFQHLNFVYDHKRTASLMKEKQLPLTYTDTLSSGIWDNCEILPEEEAGMQGRELIF